MQEKTKKLLADVVGWCLASVLAGVVLAVFLAVPLFGLPMYKVWSAGKAGEAALRRAESEKQILVAQASAEKEAAAERAEAIQIVGKAAQEFPEYRLQEFLMALGEALQNGDVQKVIFLPTDGVVPVIDADQIRTKLK